jgi:hypothetical protein
VHIFALVLEQYAPLPTHSPTAACLTAPMLPTVPCGVQERERGTADDSSCRLELPTIEPERYGESGRGMRPALLGLDA